MLSHPGKYKLIAKNDDDINTYNMIKKLQRLSPSDSVPTGYKEVVTINNRLVHNKEGLLRPVFIGLKRFR